MYPFFYTIEKFHNTSVWRRIHYLGWYLHSLGHLYFLQVFVFSLSSSSSSLSLLILLEELQPAIRPKTVLYTGISFMKAHFMCPSTNLILFHTNLRKSFLHNFCIFLWNISSFIEFLSLFHLVSQIRSENINRVIYKTQEQFSKCDPSFTSPEYLILGFVMQLGTC